ncbi:hypothetical protein PoB_006826300 [Plakobranchus ocellatus]|uniref:Secreted protein n=1 Tax=Plakobranchus ocellatus TaxID=259542 RepID=A0AAV4DBX4_9GAST|nr:hypothetical protein PoB_006826300 [Plakobranchus ocellatus]
MNRIIAFVFCLALFKANGGAIGTLDSVPALRSAGTRLSRVRALSRASWPDGWLFNLRSPGVMAGHAQKPTILCAAKLECIYLGLQMKANIVKALRP